MLLQLALLLLCLLGGKLLCLSLLLLLSLFLLEAQALLLCLCLHLLEASLHFQATTLPLLLPALALSLLPELSLAHLALLLLTL